MNITDLRELLVCAPTGGPESSALAVLTSLARDRDLAAAQTLLSALATALGCEAAFPVITAATSIDELIVADLPAPLCAYAAALEPRTFIANVERLTARPESSDGGAMANLRQLILSRDALQHEALKAHVLTALAELIAMSAQMGNMTSSELMPILDHVLANTCIVEGREADASLRFGREKLLEPDDIRALYFIITHELNHNLLDLMMGRRSGEAAPSHESALSELATALPGILEAARQQGGRPFEENDTRTFLGAEGVRLLCTHERRTGGSYFHLSLMHHAGPVDLHIAAKYAYFVLTVAGIKPSDAAAAWSPRGALHFGFRGDEQDVSRIAAATNDIAARIQDAVTNGPIWIDELRANGRLGQSEIDVPIALGVEPRRPRAYGNDLERRLTDANVVAHAEANPSLDALDEPTAVAFLAAAWRSASAAVLQRLLRDQVGLAAKLRTANWPISEIGSSLYALRDEHGVVSYHGPTLSDIDAVLLALHDAAVPLDGPADADGRSLLIRAAFKNADLVQLALKCGADPNRLSDDGETPLPACAMVGNVATAEALLAAGASIDLRDSHGRTALHRAAEQGHEEMLVWLLAHGAEATVRDNQGYTPLILARTPAAVSALCDAGASIEASTNTGLTALHISARYGRAETVRALLSRNADPDTPTRTGDTPLHYAALAHDGSDCLAALLDAGVDIDEEAHDGMTALMIAARHAHLDALELLIQRGANVDARTVTGNTALIMTSDGRNEWNRDMSFNDRIEQCLRRLVAAGADVNAVNDSGITALHAATWGFDAGRVECLLELGADPDIAALDGSTPLSVAQAKEHAAMADALIAAARKKEKDERPNSHQYSRTRSA